MIEKGIITQQELLQRISEQRATYQALLKQIDGTGAKLLIEALSGRWSYDTEQRKKRTVWYHVANAFSLLVANLHVGTSAVENIKVISNYDR